MDPPINMNASQNSGSCRPAHTAITSPAMTASPIFWMPDILPAPYSGQQSHDQHVPCPRHPQAGDPHAGWGYLRLV